MPDFDFDAYNHHQAVESEIESEITTPAPSITSISSPSTNGIPTVASSAADGEEVDKW